MMMMINIIIIFTIIYVYTYLIIDDYEKSVSEGCKYSKLLDNSKRKFY